MTGMKITVTLPPEEVGQACREYVERQAGATATGFTINLQKRNVGYGREEVVTILESVVVELAPQMGTQRKSTDEPSIPFNPTEWGFQLVIGPWKPGDDAWTLRGEGGHYVIYTVPGNGMMIRFEVRNGGYTHLYSGAWPSAAAGAVLMELLGFSSEPGRHVPATPSGICRGCGCTDEDCGGCVDQTGGPCSWVNEEHTLCSACLESGGEEVKGDE